MVTWLRARKRYKKIVGLGICYSAYTFALAQRHKRLFDALMCDSCWVSLATIAQALARDPYLMIDPQFGSNWLVRALMGWWPCNLVLSRLINWLVPDRSALEPIGQVGIPVLFVHGQQDLLVPADLLVKELDNRAFVYELVLLAGRHAINYKEPAYKRVCEGFIDRL